jgi:hypothetical protein
MISAEEIAALKAQVAELSHRTGVLEDIHAVRTLHFKYGYYMDRWLFAEVVELFAENCEIHLVNGIFYGKKSALRLYGGAAGEHGPAFGILTEHLQLQDVVDVAPDRQSAKGRFRCFLTGGVHCSKPDGPGNFPSQFWEGGIYENTYVKEDGVWKIKVLNYNIVWQAEYETGWAKSKGKLLLVSPFSKTYPEDPHGPDELMTAPLRFWPDVFVVPFHYAHPVTGNKPE